MFIKQNFRRPKSTVHYEVSQTVQDASLSVKEVATMALNGTLDFSLITPRLNNSAPDDDLDDTDDIDIVPQYGQDIAEMSESADYLHKLESELKKSVEDAKAPVEDAKAPVDDTSSAPETPKND